MGPPTSGPRAALERFGLRTLLGGWRRGYRQVAGRPAGMAPFYAWAGVAIARDLAPRPGRAGLPPAALDALHRWTSEQKRRAGVAG
jgi:hypothetical protein